MKRLCTFLLACLLLASLLPGSAAAATLTDDANKYDFFTSYCGYPDDKGVNTYSECYQTTDFIAVKAGDTVAAGPFKVKQPVYATVYKADKTTVVKQIIVLAGMTELGDLNGAGSLRAYKIPTGGAYVRLTLAAEYYNTFFVTVNRTFSVAEYNAWIAAQGLEKYLEFARAGKSKFSGKKLVAVGDSVGHGSYEKNYEGATKAAVKIAFAGRMSNLLGFASYSNSAQGGATFTDKHSARILKQIQENAKKDTEYLLIEGGMVDLYAYNNTVEPCGYLSESFDPNTFAPENTFIGGLERSLYAATTQSPNAVIAFLIPYSVKVAYGGRFGWERLFRYIPIVCEKWGVPVIDLYHNETVNDVMAYVDDIGPNIIFYDNLHCAPHTYTACALEASIEFLNLPKYDKNNRKTPTNIPASIAKATWAMPDCGYPPVSITLEGNLYTGQNTTTYENSSYKKLFVTSDYIAVNPGDVLTLGPCSPYTLRLIQGFDSAKKDVTGYLDDMVTELVSVLPSGQLILQYTVPEKVKFVKVSFEAEDASPVVTKNQPFDGETYIAWLSAALENKPVTTPKPVTTQTPETAEEPGTAASEGTGSSGTETTEIAKSGCGSLCFCSLAVLPVAILPLLSRKKLKKED